MDIKVVGPERFPRILKEIPDAPLRLFTIGALSDDKEITIAIVGTRKASEVGIRTAQSFARDLSLMGITIVSGLAMGIDTAAHEGALLGGTRTIAVLGNGLNKIYPAQNENLAKEIIEKGGGIVSEYEENMPSLKQNFIQRNRIISGLALATIVIEAPLSSGALSTAGFAASQGREVFVVPGPISHPNYAGSHALLRDGSRLVTSPLEIIEDLGLNRLPFGNASVSKNASITLKLSSDEELIFIKVKEQSSPLQVDKIIELTKLSPQIVNQALTSLSIKGFIQESSGGYTI